jgi:hypothetical protein
VLGKGGLIDAGVGIIEDLQSGGVGGVVGAIQKAATINQTFKGKDLRSIVQDEARGVLTDVLRNTQPGANRQAPNTNNGWSFPRTPGINPNA